MKQKRHLEYNQQIFIQKSGNQEKQEQKEKQERSANFLTFYVYLFACFFPNLTISLLILLSNFIKRRRRKFETRTFQFSVFIFISLSSFVFFVRYVCRYSIFLLHQMHKIKNILLTGICQRFFFHVAASHILRLKLKRCFQSSQKI